MIKTKPDHNDKSTLESDFSESKDDFFSSFDDWLQVKTQILL